MTTDLRHSPGRHPLIVIAGETAAGKSALAIALAERFNGEIICADSWTVYRDFDIGAAKPSAAEQARVPHHLLDVAGPEEGFSAAIFKRLASETIGAITARGKLPIMAGGTGLYVDSILYDYQFLPAPAPEIRERLSILSIAELLAEAARRGLDVSAIDTRNKRRIIRLIENGGAMPQRSGLRPDTLLLGISLSPEHRFQAIAERVDHMISSGLEDEVRQLSYRYGWDIEPMKGIGYREFRPYLSGKQGLGRQGLAEVRQAIISDTLALVKKQRTWFRRNKSIHWLATEGKLAEAVDLATTFLNK